MINRLSGNEFLKLSQEWVKLDVRTTGEYRQGHIPGALNLPLFSDEERAEIGILYKKEGPQKAFLRGLDLAGAKMSWYVTEACRLAGGKKAALHCWRGGQRSHSMATLLAFAGFEVCLLSGGYKAYRRYVLDGFHLMRLPFVVVGGPTGTGKTAILKALKNLGEQVIDLEMLACHKGSAFGAIGQHPQPTVEQFENNLFEQITVLSHNRRIWIENESKGIGRVFIPAGFWEQMKSAPLFLAERIFSERIGRLIAEYGSFSQQELLAAVSKIEKRLGGKVVKDITAYLTAGQLEAATAAVLHYYDKTYLHATAKGNFTQVLTFDITGLSDEEAAEFLIKQADKYGL